MAFLTILKPLRPAKAKIPVQGGRLRERHVVPSSQNVGLHQFGYPLVCNESLGGGNSKIFYFHPLFEEMISF